LGAGQTGRIVKTDKRGFIATKEPRILETLRLTAKDWEYLPLTIQKRSINTIHGLERLKAHEKKQPKHWLPDQHITEYRLICLEFPLPDCSIRSI